MPIPCSFFFFFFNDTATTEIYTLSLHDALPISIDWRRLLLLAREHGVLGQLAACLADRDASAIDRKSTRLNSSHGYISYAVFCLKKKTIRISLSQPRRDGSETGSMFREPRTPTS